nr:integrase arm-type DNA-binding domain-containing protein [Bradyrhizobium arachidis]
MRSQVPSVRSAALRHHRSSRCPWTPDLARKEAKRLLALVANGKDPVDDKATARLRRPYKDYDPASTQSH